MNQELPKKVLLILTFSFVLVAVGLGLTLLLFPFQAPSEKAPPSLIQKVHFLLSPLRHFQAAILQKQVLGALEKDLQFCQVVNQTNLGKEKKEFRLICNGRPFLAVWEKEKVTYELNGWSFLQNQPEILKELQDNHCRLYQTQENLLSFICQDNNLRKYTFSTPDFQLSKQKEEVFLSEIFENLWQRWVFPCEITSVEEFDWQDEPLLALNLNCQDYQTKVFFNFKQLAFTLPVVIDQRLTDQEKIQKSIDLLHLHFCNPGQIQASEEKKYLASFECPKTGQLTIEYDLETEMASFLFNRDDFANLFFYVGNYLFPFLEDQRPELLKETKEVQSYAVANQVIIARLEKETNFISQAYLKIEEIK